MGGVEARDHASKQKDQAKGLIKTTSRLSHPLQPNRDIIMATTAQARENPVTLLKWIGPGANTWEGHIVSIRDQ
jgi:hypothetical protein